MNVREAGARGDLG